MTLGVLHGLWRYGHLRIDHASRKMDVSDEIKRRIAACGLGLDTLPGIDSEVVERELMIEKLTGHVLPSSGHPKAPPLPRLAVDHARALDITLDGASRSAIADAFNHTIAIALRRLEARPEDAEGPCPGPDDLAGWHRADSPGALHPDDAAGAARRDRPPLARG